MLSHDIKEERRGCMAGISINEAYNHFAGNLVAKENANVDKHKKSINMPFLTFPRDPIFNHPSVNQF